MVDHGLDKSLTTALVEELLDVGPVVLALLVLFVEGEELCDGSELEVAVEVLRLLEDSDSECLLDEGLILGKVVIFLNNRIHQLDTFFRDGKR